MKHSIYILLIFLASCLPACLPFTAPDRISDDLSRAAGWMWTAPDSALHLLESFPHPEKLTGREQADYALLLSHARYRGSPVKPRV